MYRVEEIRSWPRDADGWYCRPDSEEKIYIGQGVRISHGVSIGQGVRISHGVSIGERVSIGQGVSIGPWASIGEEVSIGERVSIGEEVSIAKSPLMIQGTRHIVYAHAPGILGIGCHCKPVEWWAENYRNVGIAEGYSEAEIEEYARYIRLAQETVAEWPMAQGT